MPLQQTQGVNIHGRDESAFATLTQDGAKQRLDVNSVSSPFPSSSGMTITRDASNYITSMTDGVKTWTFTRNASKYITSWSVT